MKNDVLSLLSQCSGLPVAETWRGEHSAIFLELGKLHRHTDDKKHASKGIGDVTIMLDCRWRLESQRSIVAGSLDSYRKIEAELAKLKAARVQRISFVGRLPEIIIELDRNRWIQSFADYKAADWGLLFRGKGSIGRRGSKIVYNKNQ